MKKRLTPISALALTILMLSPLASTAQQYRLDRAEYYRSMPPSSPLQIEDEARYYYSNGRGSDANDEDIWFDKEEWYSDKMNNPNRVTSQTIRTYNSNNDVVEEIPYRYRPNISQLQPEGKVENLYSNNRLDSLNSYEYVSGQYNLTGTGKYIYDNNGNLIIERGYIQGMASATAEQHYFYDASNRLIKDSSFFYNGGTASTTYVIVYDYDGAGNLLTLTGYDYSTGSKNTYVKIHYYYDANNKLIGDSTSTVVNPNVKQTHLYTYDGQGRIATTTAETISSNNGTLLSHDSTIESYSYTSFGYIDYYNSDRHDVRGVLPRVYDSTQYYYAMYFPVNANSVAKQTSDLVAYPVPSSDFINLKWEAEKTTAITGRIVNMYGQVVQQWSDNADGVYYKSINVANLSAGNYYIVIAADGKQIEKKITVIK